MADLKRRIALSTLRRDITRIRDEIEALAREGWQPHPRDDAACCRLAACRRHRACQSDAVRRACGPACEAVGTSARRRKRPPGGDPAGVQPQRPGAARPEPVGQTPPPSEPALYWPKDFA